MAPEQGTFETFERKADVAANIAKVTKQLVMHTISIPEIVVLLTGDVAGGRTKQRGGPPAAADPRAETPATVAGAPALGGVQSELLRVECLRCFRIVEIQRLDAIKVNGSDAVWRDVGRRFIGQADTRKDGCWPGFRS
jgi:hypothetical protein